jgi:hypothetical protein
VLGAGYGLLLRRRWIGVYRNIGLGAKSTQVTGRQPVRPLWLINFSRLGRRR